MLFYQWKVEVKFVYSVVFPIYSPTQNADATIRSLFKLIISTPGYYLLACHLNKSNTTLLMIDFIVHHHSPTLYKESDVS